MKRVHSGAMTMFHLDGRMLYSHERHPGVFMIHDPARGLENGVVPFWIGNVVRHRDRWLYYTRHTDGGDVETQEEAVRALVWAMEMHNSGEL